MKTQYTEEAADVDFTFGYERVEPTGHPYFFIDTADGEAVTLELKPSQLRQMAMRLIKLSYRVDIKE